MAIDVCSEISSTVISPRISFSHDLKQTTEHNVRSDQSLLDSDFDFCISTSFVQELTSADELFSNGKILPIQIKKPNPISSSSLPIKKKQLKEFLLIEDEEEEEEDERSSKSFWQFKRSKSLNCDSSIRRKGLIRSIQFLTRSNSTGSAPIPTKQQPQKPQLQKQNSVPNRKKPAPFYPYSYYSGENRLRKCGSYGSNGVTITPVVNISRGTVNLFGLGSFFCKSNAKVKTKKREKH